MKKKELSRLRTLRATPTMIRWAKNTKVTYKKYLYSMRGLLNAIYVYEFDKIPPLSLKDTVQQLKNIVPEKVYKTIQNVIEIKSQGLERDTILRIKEFDDFFNLELEKEYLNFKERRPDIKVFNEFLQNLVLYVHV